MSEGLFCRQHPPLMLPNAAIMLALQSVPACLQCRRWLYCNSKLLEVHSSFRQELQLKTHITVCQDDSTQCIRLSLSEHGSKALGVHISFF